MTLFVKFPQTMCRQIATSWVIFFPLFLLLYLYVWLLVKVFALARLMLFVTTMRPSSTTAFLLYHYKFPSCFRMSFLCEVMFRLLKPYFSLFLWTCPRFGFMRILRLNETASEKLVSWSYHNTTSVTLLSIVRVDSNFLSTFMIGTI